MVAMLAFAGCVEEEPGEPETEQTDAPETSTATSQPSSSSAPTPSAAPKGCDPTVTKAGDQYVARCALQYHLDYTGAKDAGFETGNGDVSFGNGPGRADVSLWGRGDTESEALERLSELTVTATATHIEVTAEDGWTQQGADIAASTQSAVGEVAIRTGNGEINVDVTSTSQTLETGNGDVETSSAIGDLAIMTGNGDITVDGDVGDMSLSSGNGEIDADVVPVASAGWSLETGNQEILLRIKEDTTRGYDITAMTGNGEITFETQETAPGGQAGYGMASEKTTGYETRAIQVDVDLFTGNGDIDVRSSSAQSAAL